MCCPAPANYSQHSEDESCSVGRHQASRRPLWNPPHVDDGHHRDRDQPQVREDPFMQAQSSAEAQLHHPYSLAAFHNVKLLLGGYLGISLLTLAAIVLLRDNAAIAPTPVWVRGTIVVIHALVTLLF